MRNATNWSEKCSNFNILKTAMGRCNSSAIWRQWSLLKHKFMHQDWDFVCRERRPCNVLQKDGKLEVLNWDHMATSYSWGYTFGCYGWCTVTIAFICSEHWSFHEPWLLFHVSDALEIYFSTICPDLKSYSLDRLGGTILVEKLDVWRVSKQMILSKTVQNTHFLKL